MERLKHVVSSGQLDAIEKAHDLDILDAKASVGAKIHNIMNIHEDDVKKMHDELRKLADESIGG